MALSENARKSLPPSFLYSFPGLSSLKALESRILSSSLSSSSQMPLSASSPSRNPFSVDRLVVVPAPSEPGKIVMYSPAYHAACTAGGILSCGHWPHTHGSYAVGSRCNMQAVSKLGLWGLFTRGLPLRIVMIGTLTGSLVRQTLDLRWNAFGPLPRIPGNRHREVGPDSRPRDVCAGSTRPKPLD
ncbi:Mitochondrial phosphate carrier protein 3 [Nymphaea thermarum]|nr:Mitochondrial phosphate carrier protein 3 [Nymphaea thermarum]